MDWTVFHKYMFLATQGAVKPLECVACHNNVSLALDKSDEPALECFYCGLVVPVGINRYLDIRAVVNEFYT